MEKIEQFWILVLDVWKNGLFGVDIGRYIIAILIFSFLFYYDACLERLSSPG